MNAKGDVQRISVQHDDAWMRVLRDTAEYDFYHLPQYHRLAEQRGEGKGLLLVFRAGEHVVALPILLRALREIAEFTDEREEYWDATSIYGYAGPISSRPDLPIDVIHAFQDALRTTMSDLGVVTVFSRLHPLLTRSALLTGLGEIHPLGQTISIDLTQTVEVQRAQFRKNHKEGINRLRKAGVECIQDTDCRYLHDFAGIYRETMSRVGATDLYFFDDDYFAALMNMEPAVFRLFVCLQNGAVIGGGLFAECCGIVQYHLGGTRTDALRLAPMKLIFDTVRLWANERKNRVFHLGGGVGSQEDSLFAFKAGFSESRHQFSIWRWVVLPDVYKRLSEQRETSNTRRGMVTAAPRFFPQYRAPIAPRGQAPQS